MMGNDFIQDMIISGLGSFFFALFFNMRKERLLLSLLGGMLTYTTMQVVYCVISMVNQRVKLGITVEVTEFMSVAVAASIATILGNWLANKKGIPKAVFVFTAIIPLIPGGALYDSIHLLFGKTESFTPTQLFSPVRVAGGIGFGIVAVASLGRLMSTLIDLLDGENKKNRKKEELFEKLEEDLHYAERYYLIAGEYEKQDRYKAKQFYMVAAQEYNRLRELADKNEYPRAYQIHKRAGITAYKIYKTCTEFQMDQDSAVSYLVKSQECYEHAILVLSQSSATSSSLSFELSEMKNWQAVLLIAEARCTYPLNDRNSLYDEAESLLSEAIAANPSNVLVYINLAEVCLARIKLIMGQDHLTPLYDFENRHTLDKDALDAIGELLDKAQVHLTVALMRSNKEINIYYKTAQIHTYRMVYYRLLKDKANEALAQMAAEHWFSLTYHISSAVLGLLYIHREYYEAINDLTLANAINDVIAIHNKTNAKTWNAKISNYLTNKTFDFA